MIKIRVNKCAAFGLEKFSIRSMQFQPKLFINKEIVPSVKSGESRYLGRYFNFEMDDKDHKVQIQSCLLNLLQRIDSLTILPSNKLLLYDRWVLSKLSWPLTVTNLSKTWVVEDLDSATTRFDHKWLELPISATLSGIILPQSKFGLNFQLPSTKFLQCQMFSAAFLNLHPVILLIPFGNLPVVEQTYNMIFIKILNRFSRWYNKNILINFPTN